MVKTQTDPDADMACDVSYGDREKGLEECSMEDFIPTNLPF